MAEIEAVYRAELPRFRRVAATIVGDRDAGRDVVQEAFATAVRKRSSYRGEGTLEAWLWQAVVNAARNARRRRPPVPTDELPEPEAAMPDLGDGRLDQAIGTLSERQRLVLFLHYYADLDYDAIGGALGIANGTVAATLNATRTALRKQLLQEVES